ncbi:hypothetical protein [Sanyastnella coralliicola]|uniref:hypothetical protein n=1 Tax=Sanyastnella coralliicola TaxID=3069118 RepID=UPI0027BA3DEB|nr:hypothetical protein [Longitalea sp. SCSIO 12813]
MLKPRLITLAIGAFALILSACSSDEYDILKGNVNAISGPDSIKINTPFEVQVTFTGGTNGCATADHLENSRTDTTIQVLAYYRVPREEQICTMVVPMHSLTMSCTLSSPGKHVFVSENGEEMFAVVGVE